MGEFGQMSGGRPRVRGELEFGERRARELKGTGSREGSRAVRTWEERGKILEFDVNCRKGRGELRGFDRILRGRCQNLAGRRGGKEWIEGIG